MKIIREGCDGNVLSGIGRAGRLMIEAFAYVPHVLVNGDARRAMFYQLYSTGIRTLPVITVVGLFTGMILGLQVGLALRRFNQEMFLGATVMISLIREMGPFVTGICLSACVGSAMAAELGTMKVNDEIAALEKKLQTNLGHSLEHFSDEIKQMLVIEIVKLYYGQQGAIVAGLRNDPDIKEAVSVLKDTGRYEKILSPETK